MLTKVVLFSRLQRAEDSTRTGRRLWVGVSENGKGTTIVSDHSKITKGLLILVV
jgi:hypothetical protein